MTVYDHRYKPWVGTPTSLPRRLWVPVRYNLRDLFSSKLFLNMYAACFIAPLLFCAVIYLHHHVAALMLFRLKVDQLLSLDARFYFMFLHLQSLGAYVLTLLIGPQLISRDLDHNALPLYLVRPSGQTAYLLGKGAAAAVVLLTVTVLPGLLVAGLHAYYDPESPLWTEAAPVTALLAGFGLLIAVLVSASLGLSLMCRTRAGTGMALLTWPVIGVLFSWFFGAVAGREVGRLFHVLGLLRSFWRRLLALPTDAAAPSVGWLLLLCVLFCVVARLRLSAVEVAA